MSSYIARDVLTAARVTEDGQSFEDLGIMERKAGQLIIKCQSYEQLSPSQEALCARIDELCAEVESLKRDEWAAGFNAGCDAVEAAYEDGRAHYEVENAKLWGLAHLVAEYVSADQCEGCVAKRACNAGELDMCRIRKAILEKLRELGIEVPS